MKFQYLFYAVGIIFLFITLAYFSYQYLFNLSDGLKTIILVLGMIIFFVAGILMEGSDI